MTATTDMTARLRAAADYIDTHGWTTGTEQDAEGRVCLTGAIRLCVPQRGDFHLIRAVLRERDRAEHWNDLADDAAEVTGFLRTAEITDADLAATFGPQWESIIALIRRTSTLTADEADRLDVPWAEVADVTWAAVADVACVAARVAARGAVLAAVADVACVAARTPAGNAAQALMVRDLIGTHGFTADHYRTLTAPWASVIGPAHPDDTKDGLA